MKATAAIVFLGMALALGAQDAGSDPASAETVSEPVSAETLGAKAYAGLPAELSAKKVSELTVGDLALLAEQRSIEKQKRHYVHGAAASSFLLPGAGQLLVGDTAGGVLHLAGQAALIAGTMYGSYLLLPAEIRDSSLSRSERKDLVEQYRDSGDEDKLYASAGVMAGGFALSVIHSFWAANDAKDTAIDNIESGKITFEPSLYIGSHGMGPSITCRW